MFICQTFFLGLCLLASTHPPPRLFLQIIYLRCTSPPLYCTNPQPYLDPPTSFDASCRLSWSPDHNPSPGHPSELLHFRCDCPPALPTDGTLLCCLPPAWFPKRIFCLPLEVVFTTHPLEWSCLCHCLWWLSLQLLSHPLVASCYLPSPLDPQYFSTFYISMFTGP